MPKVSENTDDFSSQGAGIGWEFGHAFDIETKTWSIWHWEFDFVCLTLDCRKYSDGFYA